MYQSVLWGDHCTPEELLWKEYASRTSSATSIISFDVVDWERERSTPEFHKHRFMAPKPVRPMEEMQKEGYIEERR